MKQPPRLAANCTWWAGWEPGGKEQNLRGHKSAVTTSAITPGIVSVTEWLHLKTSHTSRAPVINFFSLFFMVPGKKMI